MSALPWQPIADDLPDWPRQKNLRYEKVKSPLAVLGSSYRIAANTRIVRTFVKLEAKQMKIFLPLLIGLFSLPVSMSAYQAIAQTSEQENIIAIKLSTEISRAIEKRQGGRQLQEKVIRRMSECSFMFAVLEKKDFSQQAKNGFTRAHNITLHLIPMISNGISRDRIEQIAAQGRKSFIELSKRNDKKELDLLLRDCRLDENSVRYLVN
jgi:hypothetical protein